MNVTCTSCGHIYEISSRGRVARCPRCSFTGNKRGAVEVPPEPSTAPVNVVDSRDITSVEPAPAEVDWSDHHHPLVEQVNTVEPHCSAPDCQLEPTHVERFCLNHWRLIRLETKNVLLSTPVGSDAFNKALSAALGKFRRAR